MKAPLVTDAQRAALALCELAQSFFGQVQLRQHAVGDGQQVLAGLRQTQVAAFTQPDVGAELLLQLLHAVAECGLRDVQHAGRRRQRALAFDFLHDGEVDAVQHDDEWNSWLRRNASF